MAVGQQPHTPRLLAQLSFLLPSCLQARGIIALVLDALWVVFWLVSRAVLPRLPALGLPARVCCYLACRLPCCSCCHGCVAA